MKIIRWGLFSVINFLLDLVVYLIRFVFVKVGIGVNGWWVELEVFVVVLLGEGYFIVLVVEVIGVSGGNI